MKFHYEALQGDGQQIQGIIDATTERLAYRNLVTRGLTPVRLAGAATQSGRVKRKKKKLGVRQYALALRELHSLVRGGVPLADAVEALSESASTTGMAQAYAGALQALRRGERAATALGQNMPGLPPYILRVFEAGEITGRLAEALGDAADQLDYELRIRGELRNSLVYPALLVAFGFLSVLFILLVVVPRFALMFKGKMDRLPWFSAFVINLGDGLHRHILTLFLAMAGIGGLVYLLLREPRNRQRFSSMALRLPVVGSWLIEVETARWAAILGRLLEAKVPLLTSLELARKTLRAERFTAQLSQVERSVRGGATLTKSLEDYTFLPSTAISLIRAGEKSGNMPEMVRTVATSYDEFMRNRLKMLLTIIEPVSICVIGGAIGLVAVAIFMAITSLNKVAV